MTRIYKIYKPYLTTLLLCFLQVAGIDVYAQEPIKTTVQDSIGIREAPKAVHAVIVIQTDRKQPILLKLPACLLTKTVSQY